MTRRVMWAWVLIGLVAAGARAEKAPAADPAKVDADFALQGEYAGSEGGRSSGAHVVALGSGKFRLVVYPGGLPGDGWNGKERQQAEAVAADGAVTFKGAQWSATLKEGKLIFANAQGEQRDTLQRVERKSPTLGARPPEGAIALFDGKNADGWEGGKITEDGLLEQGTASKQKFKDCTLHVEFRLPYEPSKRGQDRGNSGVYLQGRYEVQVLDSFGLKGENNECGGIYTVSAPKMNMCYPPLAWQTYDIDFTAPRFDENGRKTANAKLTVRHNGVLIQENVQAPGPTTAAPNKESPEAGPIYLQDHGHPVRYQNIWLVEKPAK